MLRFNQKTFSVLITIIIVSLSWNSCSKTTTSWDGGRRAGGILGIVNDSLALQMSVRCWTKTTTGFMADDVSDGCTHEGLFLINYRTKQPPLWGDTLDSNVFLRDQLSDSVLYGGDRKTRISFWKIGEKPIVKDIRSWSGNCSPSLIVERVRPWFNGTFLMLGDDIPDGGDSCQYAVLDTATGLVEQSRFSDVDAWMAGCEDINYFNGDVVCLKKSESTSCFINILTNDVLVDSIVLDSCGFLNNMTVAFWMGRHIRLDIFTTDSSSPAFWKNGGADPVVQFNPDIGYLNLAYPITWLTMPNLSTLDGLGNEITYTGSDLVVVPRSEL